MDKKLIDEWKKLNNVLIGTTKGGRNNQLINFISEGRTISVKCFGDVAAGEAIALRDDDGQWYVTSSQKSQINSNFRKEIEYRKTKTKRILQSNLVGFGKYKNPFFPTISVDRLSAYSEGETERLDLNPALFREVSSVIARDYPFIQGELSYESIYFSQENPDLLHVFRASHSSTELYIMQYSFQKINLSDLTAEVSETIFLEASHRPVNAGSAFPKGFIIKYLDGEEVRLIAVSSSADSASNNYGTYIWDLNLIDDIRNPANAACFFGDYVVAFNPDLSSGLLIYPEIRGCYGVQGGIVIRFDGFSSIFSVVEWFQLTGLETNPYFEVFVPANFLKGESCVVLDGTDFIVEPNDNRLIYFSNASFTAFNSQLGQVPERLNNRRAYLLDVDENTLPFPTSPFLSAEQIKRIYSDFYARLYLVYQAAIAEDLTASSNLGEVNLFFPVSLEDAGTVMFDADLSI